MKKKRLDFTYILSHFSDWQKQAHVLSSETFLHKQIYHNLDRVKNYYSQE